MSRKRSRLIDQFDQHLQRNEATGCLEWTRSCDRDGYGYIRVGPKLRRVHQVAYERTHGPIPQGQWVLHRCDNPKCGNPSHLFLGDNKINVADKVAKGRHAYGERNGRANLTEEDIRQIRFDYARGERQVDLAKRFGVHQTHISLIVTRKEWAHVA